MKPRYSFSSRHTGKLENIRKQRGKYPELLKKIVEEADIILEILDARFPDETRNFEFEEQLKNSNKKIIYVLNKSDLATGRKFEPSPKVFVSCKTRTGVKQLRDLIKIISKRINKKKEEKVMVGVIGYPNTGKSSLINSLIGKASAGTASKPGFTRGIQKLKLAENIYLLDSPGVIPEKEYSSIEKEKIIKHAKVGSRSYDNVKEPELVIAELVREYPEIFEKFYKIPAKGDSEFLIGELGRKKGFMKKGGLVDEDRTARFILRDWQEGKIRI